MTTTGVTKQMIQNKNKELHKPKRNSITDIEIDLIPSMIDKLDDDNIFDGKLVPILIIKSVSQEKKQKLEKD